MRLNLKKLSKSEVLPSQFGNSLLILSSLIGFTFSIIIKENWKEDFPRKLRNFWDFIKKMFENFTFKQLFFSILRLIFIIIPLSLLFSFFLPNSTLASILLFVSTTFIFNFSHFMQYWNYCSKLKEQKFPEEKERYYIELATKDLWSRVGGSILFRLLNSFLNWLFKLIIERLGTQPWYYSMKFYLASWIITLLSTFIGLKINERIINNRYLFLFLLQLLFWNLLGLILPLLPYYLIQLFYYLYYLIDYLYPILTDYILNFLRQWGYIPLENISLKVDAEIEFENNRGIIDCEYEVIPIDENELIRNIITKRSKVYSHFHPFQIQDPFNTSIDLEVKDCYFKKVKISSLKNANLDFNIDYFVEFKSDDTSYEIEIVVFKDMKFTLSEKIDE